MQMSARIGTLRSFMIATTAALALFAWAPPAAAHETQICSDGHDIAVIGDKGVLGPAIGCTLRLECPSGGPSCKWQPRVIVFIDGLASGSWTWADSGIPFGESCIGALECRTLDGRWISTPAGGADTVSCTARTIEVGGMGATGLYARLYCYAIPI